jgi:hypothetical protein
VSSDTFLVPSRPEADQREVAAALRAALEVLERSG